MATFGGEVMRAEQAHMSLGLVVATAPDWVPFPGDGARGALLVNDKRALLSKSSRPMPLRGLEPGNIASGNRTDAGDRLKALLRIGVLRLAWHALGSPKS
jgi:hypothetical protein